MKTIKIKFVDFWDHFNHEKNFITEILQRRYHVELSEQPQYIFYSNFGNKCNHMLYKDSIKIFYTQENLVPDFNMCDYGIGFEYMEYGDRFLRYPLYYYRYKEDFLLMEQKHLITQEEIALKKKFCSIVVSNGKNADPIREDFFNILSRYKKVDSGGRYKNNIGKPNGVLNKRKFQERYKFALCFENTSHSGYTTEKIIEAFAAKTIPIYWGDPEIARCFHKDSFVNVMDYNTIEEAVLKIKELDQNAELYEKMIQTAALVNEGQNSLEAVNTRLESFLYHIFDQPFQKAYRRNNCYWGERYQEAQFKMRRAYMREYRIKESFQKIGALSERFSKKYK